jgi:hypothetical protein
MFDALEKNGPDGIEFPKKPKGDLEQLLHTKSKKVQPTIDELHTYLVSHITNDITKQYFSVIVKIKEVNKRQLTLWNLKPLLKTGYAELKNRNANILAAKLDFGEILIVTKKYFDYENKKGGKLLGTWKKWLKININISERYDNKLRQMSRIFSNYPKFKQLGISFSELYEKRKLIDIHLKTNELFANFWKQV